MSVHSATALLVQPDDAFGPFKVANPHGAVGVLDQDRLAGVRAHLGTEPPFTPVTSTVTSTDDGVSREGSTHVTLDRALPDLALSHLLANVDTVFDAIGPGTAELRWVVEGTRASGEPFTLDVENAYASQHDIAYDATFDAQDQILSIQQNEFEDVEITGVDYTATVSSAFEQYTVSSVEVRRPDGTYQQPPSESSVPVPAGSTLDVRVTLAPYKNQGDAVTVELSADVPDDAAGSYGWVDIAGGSDSDGDDLHDDDTDDDQPDPSGNGAQEQSGADAEDESDGAADFEGLLDDLTGLVPNNSVSATMNIETENETGFNVERSTVREATDQVVTGSFSFSIDIVE